MNGFVVRPNRMLGGILTTLTVHSLGCLSPCVSPMFPVSPLRGCDAAETGVKTSRTATMYNPPIENSTQGFPRDT
jgi:hypothetical protein